MKRRAQTTQRSTVDTETPETCAISAYVGPSPHIVRMLDPAERTRMFVIDGKVNTHPWSTGERIGHYEPQNCLGHRNVVLGTHGHCPFDRFQDLFQPRHVIDQPLNELVKNGITYNRARPKHWALASRVP